MQARLEQLRDRYGTRAVGMTIALALELLLLLALLSLSQGIDPPPRPQLIEVDLSARDYSEASPETPEPASEPQAAEQRAQLDEAAPPLSQPAPAPRTLFPPPAPAPSPAPSAAPDPAPEEAPRPARAGVRLGSVQGPAGSGSREGDSQRVGTAPNGEPLYAARWYREPYPDELRGYLLTATGPGWGLIACRTAPNWRVEDCVPLDEYPNGSLINRAVIAASWQFKVRPPRRGGQSLVGSWVRIRIDYNLEPEQRRN